MGLVDYTVFLPHYSPLMPSLTTTFTDMCPSLANTMLRGAEVAEKRRQLMAEIEHAAVGGARTLAAQDAALQAAAGPSPLGEVAPRTREGSVVTPLLSPLD